MLFLNESLKVDSNKDIIALDSMLEEAGIIAEDYDVFSGDEIGAMEICLEMETAFAALTQDMIMVEHRAIVNEDTELINEAEESFWQKIVKAFQAAWAAVKGWFAKAIDALKSHFQNAEKWWNDNKKELIGKSTKAKVYPNLVSGSIFGLDVASKIKSIETKESLDSFKKEFNSKNLKEKILGGEQKEMEVKGTHVDRILSGSNVGIAKLKSSMAVSAATFNGAIAAAKAGMKTGDEAEKKRLKEKVEVAKGKVALLKQVDAVALSCYKTIVSQAMAVARKLGGNDKKEEKKKA